ncbi:PREDICTED: uncharacterized protein LOC106927173 [Poecilia mexicana]|uniref:uncharacterized protein LOC106927173 n=1 Tax=Poecilia mexicana TaxID=48701 RepID=UPI00072D93FB|nr:PREDICTED: uncharacterized protein LOC106927173 [Poecilia mexicana]XP_014858025.1 PREDICTED: uncharacterized protein LOC106927173 [Poecilia mexicana]
MKCFLFCLLLLAPLAVMGVQGQIKAQRRHVLIFLNEAFGATTERATAAKVTAKRSPDKPPRHQDSNDLSEMQSVESFVTPGYPGPDQSGSESKETSKDHDSYEVVDPKAGADAPSRRNTQTGTGKMQQLDKISRHVQGRSQEQIFGQGKQQGSGGQTDPDSEEGTTVRSGRATQSTSVQIQGERLDAEKSMETSWESTEVNDGKLAVVHNNKETREYISSETYPFDPSRLSAPVKSGPRATSSD